MKKTIIILSIALIIMTIVSATLFVMWFFENETVETMATNFATQEQLIRESVSKCDGVKIENYAGALIVVSENRNLNYDPFIPVKN